MEGQIRSRRLSSYGVRSRRQLADRADLIGYPAARSAKMTKLLLPLLKLDRPCGLSFFWTVMLSKPLPDLLCPEGPDPAEPKAEYKPVLLPDADVERVKLNGHCTAVPCVTEGK